MNLATIPAHAPFLDTLADRWLAMAGDEPAHGLILLPTRRSARALAEAFLRASGGKPMLLPRITAIGALDETPLALSGALDLPPAVEPLDRLAHLARLVLALPEAAGGVRAADRAWRLAAELAKLMDEAEWAEIDLPAGLAKAADGAHAKHWGVTVRFLAIVTRAWPDWLAEQGLTNPAARKAGLLRAQADAWTDRPPPEPVWAAGMTAGFPSVAKLLGAVANMPGGQVILPALDLDMSDEIWAKLKPGHPQAGFQALLQNIGARRGDVSPLPCKSSITARRPATLFRALLPAPALAAWREPFDASLGDMRRLAPADAQEEAAAIALALRDAVGTPGRRAALVTPDRALAGRVAAELLRWGVVADDSAGEPLSQSPPAVFLRLIARAVANDLAPVALLSVLKHPLAACGVSPVECRASARAIERAALRGPKPPPGLTGLRQAAGGVEGAFLAALEFALEPLLRADAAVALRPDAQMAALVDAAERIAATDESPGPARLWAHEEGEALAALLSGAIAALATLPDQKPSVLPGLFDAVLEGEVVRGRRALRGRDAQAEHPRVFIWGLLEARLQAVDLIVLGGLVDGVWPPATDSGPWMSREMRERAGLPNPEERVGQAAHDFISAACSAPTAILSAPRRRDGAPAVESRFLVRLNAFLAGPERGEGGRLPIHPAADWARRLDQPAGPPTPVEPPAPRPPIQFRPRRLSVTQIETLIADPYAIYARHVLKLRPLDPLEQATDAADYGSLVHTALHAFIAKYGLSFPPNARDRLREIMDEKLSQRRLRPALSEWWAPRLRRIADWVAEAEIERRATTAPVLISTEIDGTYPFDAAGPFQLVGRADRIEKRADGTLAILDYKTGAPPSEKDVETGRAPQLPLEAAMAAAGAFGPELRGETSELVYWRLSGGHEPGKARALLGSDPARIADEVARARDALRALLVKFSQSDTPYLSQPHPGRIPRFPDYAHLARVSEWTAAGEGDHS